MMPRRRYLSQLATLALLPLLSRCAWPSPPLAVACHVWPGYELMFLARKEGWLPQSGITLVETASATASLQALRDSRVDGAALTLDETLRLRAEGMALTIVLVFDVSVGADQVLGQPGITRLADLAGKRIGVERSALGALMLHQALAAARLDIGQVKPVPLAIDRHLSAWRAGQIDAVVTYEPIAGQLVQQGAQRLFDSRKIPNTIFDVLAIKTDALPARATAIRALLAGHFRGLAHLKKNPLDAGYRMARRLGASGDRVPDLFRGLELPDVYANRKLLAAVDGGLLTAAQTVSALLVEEGFIHRTPPLDRLFDAGFLPTED